MFRSNLARPYCKIKQQRYAPFLFVVPCIQKHGEKKISHAGGSSSTSSIYLAESRLLTWLRETHARAHKLSARV